jgi:hypothetical protein
MTPLDATAVVRASWARLAADQVAHVGGFRTRLAALCPDTGELLATAVTDADLVALADGVVDAAGEPPRLVHLLATLGTRHAAAVLWANGTAIGDALLATVAAASDDDDRSGVVEAWRDTYALSLAIVRQAARRAATGRTTSPG